VLNEISAKLDTETLIDLNSQVQTDSKDPLDVAKAWVSAAGLS
jgi:osmoprotectant transport system substrate-binding protein